MDNDFYRQNHRQNNSYQPYDPYMDNGYNYDYDFYEEPMDFYDDYPHMELIDYGAEPFVVDINEATKQNTNFRTALWTGNHLQLTLMSIDVGEDIGFEVHHDLDQFIRIEEGQGMVLMGNDMDNLDFQVNVYDDYAFIIPAGKWHNLINTGDSPIKLYSIYAPPQHPHGTVHVTREDAQEAEDHHNNDY